MTSIDSHRVEKRYLIDDLDALVQYIQSLGFERKYFSDRSITCTYFCDTQDLSLPQSDRIKIRQYVTEIPTKIDYDQEYKLNFKYHEEKSVSRKESFHGTLRELLHFATEKTGLDIQPVMAMSYERHHYTLPDNEDIRITIDFDILFHKIVDKHRIEQFSQMDNPLVEIKLNPDSEQALSLEKSILKNNAHQLTISKKITMYEQYQEKFS